MSKSLKCKAGRAENQRETIEKLVAAAKSTGVCIAGAIRRLTIATVDHNVPTADRDKPWPDPLSIQQPPTLSSRRSRRFRGVRTKPIRAAENKYTPIAAVAQLRAIASGAPLSSSVGDNTNMNGIT